MDPSGGLTAPVITMASAMMMNTSKRALYAMKIRAGRSELLRTRMAIQEKKTKKLRMRLTGVMTSKMTRRTWMGILNFWSGEMKSLPPVKLNNSSGVKMCDSIALT